MNNKQELSTVTEDITQDQRLTRLVEVFKADSGEFGDLETPKSVQERRRVLRSLMNIRMPRPLPLEVLAMQDDYLRQRAAERASSACGTSPSFGAASPFGRATSPGWQWTPS